MEKLKLTIEGYKRFETKQEFHLNSITLFTGANSVGKSSVIQSILLGRIVSETLIEDSTSDIIPIHLHGDKGNKYALDLGYYKDITNRNSTTGNIEFSFGECSYGVYIDDNEDEKNPIIFRSLQQDREKLKSIFGRGFSYLSADRMAPLYEYKESVSNDWCDCHGSNVGDIIKKHQDDSAISKRSLFSKDKIMLTTQLDEWSNYIFPGVSIRVTQAGEQTYKIKERKDAATNVGFGITYALPILVSGLTVPEGGILIVENPEAHLHAKAQSNMGYFLARMAAAGVRVIIETHSEHIVNGIRRMIVEGKTEMSHEDMTIYFFQDKNGEKNIMEITMDDIGNLSEFPMDFFDQVRQDMLELMNLERKRKGMKDGEW